MSDRKPPTLFEIAKQELSALGIALTSLPGEYCVCYREGADKAARIVDDLGQALEIGRAMAAGRPDACSPMRRRSRVWRRSRGKAARNRHPQKRRRSR